MAEVVDDFIWVKVRAEPTTTPGLFLHKQINEDGFDSRWWTVTHQKSGLMIARSMVKRKARQFAERLGNGKIDWTLSEKELKETYDWAKLSKGITKLKYELGMSN